MKASGWSKTETATVPRESGASTSSPWMAIPSNCWSTTPPGAAPTSRRPSSSSRTSA
ncbi:hypothetical protein [Streptomyces rapamycinicus]|uniref:hypothetical protein n=1 Tax=Streptomyces rapamycinicus TaxID=1226757 RepID=UPI0020CA115D|nr:hypothetical protein [Streptomyces rapamycinicus]UTP35670.1 hypothetical protein LIV37_44200 [Streptomyces rapamycinicus NRRL 5491]